MADTQPSPEIDHRALAARCFNACWDILERPERSSDDLRELVLLAHASLWHWSQVPGHTGQNLSVGWWMVSRAQAVAGNPDAARAAADASLEAAAGEQPFFVGYAWEAVARAAHVAGDAPSCEKALENARRFAAAVESDDDRTLLLADLGTF